MILELQTLVYVFQVSPEKQGRNDIQGDDDWMNEESGFEPVERITNPFAGLITMAVQIVKGALPYPDLLRRWKIRRSARSLITFTPWPGNDATPLQLAQLCLVRGLAIQRQTHRAVRWRQREAAALLARSSVENTILGLWCLYSNEPMDRLRGSVGHTMKGTFKYLIDDDPLKAELIDLLVEEIGGEGALPNIHDMAELVKTEAKTELSTDLYRRVYVPLSSFFSHANGFVLMRHIKSSGVPKYRPSYPWNRRGPVRTADTCLGIIALAVCHRSDKSSAVAETFEKYSNAHMSRTLAPLPIMAGRRSRESVKWRRLPSALARLRKSIEYLNSIDGKNSSWDAREAHVRSDITWIMSVFEPDTSKEFVPRIVDVLVRMVVGEKPA